MGRQDRHRRTDPISKYLSDRGVTRIKWHKGRRVLEIDTAFRDTDTLAEILYGEAIKGRDPCIILHAMDMGSFTSYFVGGLVDEGYCSSGISSHVFGLLSLTLDFLDSAHGSE